MRGGPSDSSCATCARAWWAHHGDTPPARRPAAGPALSLAGADRARRPHGVSRSLGALALAPAAHADLRHRALRGPRQLSLPLDGPTLLERGARHAHLRRRVGVSRGDPGPRRGAPAVDPAARPPARPRPLAARLGAAR